MPRIMYVLPDGISVEDANLFPESPAQYVRDGNVFAVVMERAGRDWAVFREFTIPDHEAIARAAQWNRQFPNRSVPPTV